jgi:hypothetical protein
MFYSEVDPYTMEKVYVPKTPKEKAMQRALLQYFRPENRDIVLEALKKAGRRDLIGSSPKCLVEDYPKKNTQNKVGSSSKRKTATRGNDHIDDRRKKGRHTQPSQNRNGNKRNGGRRYDR